MKGLMFVLTFLSLGWLLGGCVTIHPPAPQVVQVAAPPPVEQARVAEGCPPYIPPASRALPAIPLIANIDETDSYEVQLEKAAEKLVAHVTLLRQYIAREHAEEEKAHREHLLACKL